MKTNFQSIWKARRAGAAGKYRLKVRDAIGQVYCLKNKLVKESMEWKLSERRKEHIGRQGRKKYCM